MKRVIISILMMCMWAFSLHAQNGEFDPERPGDPQPFYSLTVQVSPSSGGTANITRTMLAEGQEVQLHISVNKNFKFQQWVCGEEVLSSDTYFHYTMPARNVVITAQLVYEEPGPSEFNPELPPDPEGQGEMVPLHLVTIYTSPSIGGRVNRSSFYMKEGTQDDVYAYPNAGYEFVGWMQNGVLFSTRNPLRIEMGGGDLNYTAIFSFNPLLPEDPGANSWDASIGAIVVDRFAAGRLHSAITSLLGNNDYSIIQSAMIVGQMEVGDVGVFQEMSSCRYIDISRTNGINVIPAWAFSDIPSLQTLMLPASIEKIENNAFFGSSSINELVLYASVPPVVAEGALDALSSATIVRVSASALNMYKQSSTWNRFDLVAMDAQTLTISLPQDAQDGRYINASLELVNQQNGQTQRYLITERTEYTFLNLFRNSNYSVSVKNSRGMVLGMIDNIIIEDQDVVLAFDSLLISQNLTLKIVTPEGEDITSSTTITWSDENGNYLQKGAVLSNVIEGVKVLYTISLDAKNQSIYEEINKQTVIVNKGLELIEKQLTRRPTITMSGKVVSSTSLLPVKGVYLSIAQSLKGNNSNVYFTETDKDGNFSIEVPKANTTIYFTDNSYLKHTLTIDSSQLSELDTIKMQPLTGMMLYVIPQYKASVLQGSEQEVVDYYADYANIDFSVYNVTQQKSMQAVVKYPIITLPEKIALGDSLSLTLTSRNNKFNPSVLGTRIDSALYKQIKAPIIQLGAIRATYQQADVDEVIALLYDNRGELVQKKVFNSQHEVQFDYLNDGNYTVVCLENLNPFNGISRLSEFVSSPLQDGKDYLLEVVTVSSGWICTAQFTNVPQIDRVILYAGENMRLTSSTSQIMVGNYLTLKAMVDFKEEYMNNISDIRLVFDLPENTEFVHGSVVLGGKIGGEYTLSDGRLTINVLRINPLQIMFCVIPLKEGVYTPCAYVKFKDGDEEKQLPIASTYYEVKGLTLNVPKVFASKTITVRGTASTRAKVEVYANDELIGTANAFNNGSWSTECTFNNASNLDVMKVYAAATDMNGVKHVSETYDCQYDKDAITISTVTMTNTAHGSRNLEPVDYVTVFDFKNPNHKNKDYWYWPQYPLFTFEIDFTKNDPTVISDVVLYVKTNDGRWSSLPASYDKQKQRWIAKKEYRSSYSLPANVAVDFQCNTIKRSDRATFDSYIDEMENFKQEINNSKDSIQAIENLYIQDSLQLQQLTLLYDHLMEMVNREREKESPDENLIDSLYEEYLATIGVGIEPQSSIYLEDEDIDSLISSIDSLLAQHDGAKDDSIIAHYREFINEYLISEEDLYGYDLGDVSDTVYVEEDNTITRIYKSSYQSFISSKPSIDLSSFVSIPMTEGRDILSYRDDNNIIILDIERDIAMVYEDVNKTGALAPRKITTASSFEDFVDAALETVELAIDALLEWQEKVLAPLDAEIKKLNIDILAIDDELFDLNVEAAAAAIRANDLEQQIKKLQLCKKGTLPRETLAKIDEQIILLRSQRNLAQMKHTSLILFKNEYVKKLNKLKKLKVAKDILFKGILSQLSFIDQLYHLFDLGNQMKNDGRAWDAFIKSIPVPCENDEDNANALVANSISDKNYIQSDYRMALGVSVIVTAVDNLVKLNKVADFIISIITSFIQDAADKHFKSGIALSKRQMRIRNNEKYALECNKEKEDEPEGEESGNEDAKHVLDPAGFVYECVENNRVEGVTATIYYKDTVRNEFGEVAEAEIVWNAEEYEQENPQITDENGEYQWFVPQGLWQVRFEKEGYEPTQSEWLPVPPPQLEVNIPIVQLRQPEVINAIAHKDAIDITFDKYMLPELLNSENIFVTANDHLVSGTITLLDKQQAYGDDAASYASKVRFVPDAEFTAPHITLTVSSRVHSYADVPMAQTFQQEFDVENVGVIEQVQMPIPSINNGSTVVAGTELTLTCTTPGATIRYTMDGSEPDCLTGLYYGAPIVLYGTDHITIKAIACAEGYNPSDVVNMIYYIDDGASSVENVQENKVSCFKILRNGQIFIIRDGRTYTVTGQEVRE